MSTLPRPVVFGDTLPVINDRARNVIYTVGFAALTALAAQITISLDFTPVPVTLQTAAVLLSGIVLGSRLGAISMTLYALAGLVLPVFADGHHGSHYLFGATGGYIIGMIVASYVTGLLAERAQDRRVLTSMSMALLGSGIIYLFGATWLSHSAHLSAQDAINKGIAPFVIGDALKVVALGLLMPAVWHFTKKDTPNK